MGAERRQGEVIMQWNSMAEFFQMGGHGYFVWCAYGMAVLAVALESIALLTGRKAAREAVKKEARKLMARLKAAVTRQ